MSDNGKDEFTFGKGIKYGLAFGIGATLAAGGLKLLWHAFQKSKSDATEDDIDNVLEE